MSWSGRQAVFDKWVPQFRDVEFARQQLDKYVLGSYAPDDARADAWMARALTRDKDRVEAESDYVSGASHYELTGCYHCRGVGYVRLDVEASHPEFGKARLCPACQGRDGNHSQHCEKCAAFTDDDEEILECWKCGAAENAPAGERCTNPAWHQWLHRTDLTPDTVLRSFG